VLAFLGGLAGGAASLMRPDWLLFVPFAVILALLFSRERRRHLAIGAAMLAGLVLIMAPWWIRNAAVMGRFIPTSLQVGASLYDGLSPEATGASDMDFVERFAAEERARAGAEPLEIRLDRRLRDESLAWARAHPGRVAELAAVKFARMWNVWPNEPSMSSWPVRIAVVGTYVPILVFGILGIVRTRRRGWAYIVCWLPAVYFTLLHVIFVSSIRYRQPALLGLTVLAAGAAVEWWTGRRRTG
jgi:4-amino-4-deoxy-L-arabinose transferase-like glycosyltransferase